MKKTLHIYVRYLCLTMEYVLMSLCLAEFEDTGYPHDGRADKDSYPHDGRADNDSYPHDRHNQYIMLSL